MSIQVLFDSSTQASIDKTLILEQEKGGGLYTLKAVKSSDLHSGKDVITDISKIVKILETTTAITAKKTEIASVVHRIDYVKNKHNSSLLLRLFNIILPQFVIAALPFRCLKIYHGIDADSLIAKRVRKEKFDEEKADALPKEIEEVVNKEEVEEHRDNTNEVLCEKYQITQEQILEEAKATGTEPETAKLDMIKRAMLYVKVGIDPLEVSPSLTKRQQTTGYEIPLIQNIEKAFAEVIEKGIQKGVRIELKDFGRSLYISGNEIFVEEGIAGTGTFKIVKFFSDYFAMKSPDERNQYVLPIPLEEVKNVKVIEQDLPQVSEDDKSKQDLDEEVPPQGLPETPKILDRLELNENEGYGSTVIKETSTKKKLKKGKAATKRRSIPLFMKVFNHDYDDPIHFKGMPYEKWRTGALERELEIVKKEKRTGGIGQKHQPLQDKEKLLLDLIEYRRRAREEMIAYEVPTVAEEYLKEIESVQLMQGPGIVELHRVMELDSGEKVMFQKAAGFQFEFNGEKKPVIELEDLIELKNKFGLSHAQRVHMLNILDHAFKGIEWLHSKGYIHRDLKPQNILITKEGKGALTDFGTVCKVKHDPAKSRYFGTPRYSAPELCAYADNDSWNSIDEKSDVWSAGMLLVDCCFEGVSTKDHRAIAGIENPEQIRSVLIDKVYKPRDKIAYCDVFKEPEDKSSLEHLAWAATRLDPEDRPTMAEFCARFNHYRKQMALLRN